MKLLHFLIAFLLTGICDQASFREKREPYTAAAIVVGIIGMNTSVMQSVSPIYLPPSGTGCEWRGSGPFCDGDCLIDQVYIRNQRKYENGVSEPGYGMSCMAGSKAYCCRLKGDDLTWSGVWQSAETGHTYTCKFYSEDTVSPSAISNQFGSLRCALTTHSIRMDDMAQIGGKLCDEVHLFGRNGSALPGKLSWKNPETNAEEVDTWYKR